MPIHPLFLEAITNKRRKPMIRPGSSVIHGVLCPDCGKSCSALAYGTYIMSVVCNNSECQSTGALMLVEKESGLVLWTDARYDFSSGKRIYPAYYFEDGTPYWPKAKD